MKNFPESLKSTALFAGVLLLLLWGCKKSSSSDEGPVAGTVTDYDGNVYPTVTIGNQVWMAANLRVKHFRDGSAIPDVSDSSAWAALTTPAYCSYENSTTNATTYALLYNWAAVTDTRNLAPAGWHVPTDAEWQTLVTYLGTGAGGKLKSTGTTLWNTPNSGASNSTGFNGIPGGDRSYNSVFHYIGMYGCFWTTTESTSTEGIEFVLTYSSSNVTRMAYSKGLGLSIRCVKD
jgi:uncharacterized protein (TIGR02145 family)